MLLDIQNTAILQIRSCGKYCFAQDGVQEIEKEIEDLREKFRGAGGGQSKPPYFERFLSMNEKRSRQVGAQELAALYAGTEQRMEDGESAYGIAHLNEYENDLSTLVRAFTAMRQSKVGPCKADAFLDLVQDKVPAVWEQAIRLEASPSRQQDKSRQKEVQKQEARLQRSEAELAELREGQQDELADLEETLAGLQKEAATLAAAEGRLQTELETREADLAALKKEDAALDAKIARQDQALAEAAAEIEVDSEGSSPRGGDGSNAHGSASKGAALQSAARPRGAGVGNDAGRKAGDKPMKPQHCGADCIIF